MSRKQRKTVAGHSCAQDTADSDLLAVLQRELRGHYEVPEDFPHKLPTLMITLNDQEPVPSRLRGKKSPSTVLKKSKRG